MINKRREIKECSQCTLSSRYEGIIISRNGICNLCREFNQKPPPGSEKSMKRNRNTSLKRLDKIFNDIKRRQQTLNKPYDVLAMLSGGKDSIYMLYQLVKRHKLRPLMVTIDTGVVASLALSNIKQAIIKLGLRKEDWIHYESNTAKKTFAPYFANEELWQMVNPCVWCNLLRKEMTVNVWETAARFSIPLIISGGEYLDPKTIDLLKPQFKIGQNFILKHLHDIPQNLIPRRQDSLQHLRNRYPNIHKMKYWEEIWHSVEEGIEIITNELGWQNLRLLPMAPDNSCRVAVARRFLLDSISNKKGILEKSKEISPASLVNSTLIRLGQINPKTTHAYQKARKEVDKEKARKALSYFLYG